jgi:exonuclease SbcD
VLDDIAALALGRDIDALVIAGDVFDHQNPSAAMYRLLFDFFERLASSNITVVMIAGNHDSIGRLEAPRRLLRLANVHAIGALRRNDAAIDLPHHLIPVRRAGETRGHILAIPYLRPADLPGFLAFDAAGEATLEAGVRRLYGEALAAAREAAGELPLVATGHLHVRGASLSESLSERRILIGGEHAIAADSFGELADYIALGHLHRAQSLGGKGRKAVQRLRYAGSPLPLSATERDYAHGVSLVDLDKRQLTIEHVSLPRRVPFLRLPAEGRLQLDEVEAALAGLGLDRDRPQPDWPFVQVHVEVSEPQPGLRGRLDDICAGFPVRPVSPDIAWPQAAGRAAGAAPTQRLSELSPEELFARAFEAEHGGAPDAGHLACFRKLIEEAAG